MSDIIQKVYKSKHHGKTIDDAIDKIDSLSADLSNVHNQVDQINTDVKNKQDKLTFDDVPTKDSNNPVKSGGVEKSISGITADLSQKENKSEKGEPGGYVPLDDGGKIPKDYFGEKTISKDNLDGTLLNDDGSIVKERMVIEIPIEDSDGDNVQDSGGDNIKGHCYVEDFVLELSDKLKTKVDTETVNTELDKKEDKSNKATELKYGADNNVDDTHYPTTELLRKELDKKQDLDKMVNDLSTLPSSTQYPSAQAVRKALEEKQDVSNMVQELPSSEEPELQKKTYPSSKAIEKAISDVYTNMYADCEVTANKATSIGDSADSNVKYPTSKAVYEWVRENTEQLGQDYENILGDVTNIQYQDFPIIEQDIINRANALKGKKTGYVVRIDDVAPRIQRFVNSSEISLPDMDVSVHSKNLITFPYASLTTNNGIGSVTKNGITFTVNEDRSLTINGTAEYGATFYFIYDTSFIKNKGLLGKTFTASISGDTTSLTKNVYFSINKYTAFERKEIFRFAGERDSYTFSTTDDFDGIIIGASVNMGNTADNLTIRPQLELGTVATEYTPYVDVSGAVLKAQGKNLIPYPYSNGSYTAGGVTYTVNKDGSIKLNGTATTGSSFAIRNTALSIPAGNYKLSGTGSTSESKYYLQMQVDNTYGQTDVRGGNYTISAGQQIDRIILFVKQGTVLSNVIVRPQLELGSVATEYEPYKSGSSHYVESDGSIAGGVSSISPTTTLTCDKANTVIVAKYNRDINKAFAELERNIAAQTSAE